MVARSFTRSPVHMLNARGAPEQPLNHYRCAASVKEPRSRVTPTQCQSNILTELDSICVTNSLAAYLYQSGKKPNIDNDQMNQNSIKMKTAQWDDRRDAVLLAT